MVETALLLQGCRFDWETKITQCNTAKKKSKVKENILKDIQMQAVSFLPKVETLLPSHFLLSSVTFLKTSSVQHGEKF